MGERILFLDIDGVLNGCTNGIEPLLVARLNRIVEAADCKVILSSTWRKTFPLGEVQAKMESEGFTGQLDGRTPKYMACAEHIEAGWRDCRDAHRGHEIKAFLSDAGYLDTPEDFPTFVILDDSGDMEPYMDRLVATDGSVGLEDCHVERALKLFGVIDSAAPPPERPSKEEP